MVPCRAYWTLKTADQWLSLRLDFIGSMLILLTAILAIAERNHISPAIAALSLSQVCPWLLPHDRSRFGR